MDQEAGALSAAPEVSPLGPKTLRGRFIVLEPLAAEHHAALRQAADGETFRYMPTPDFDAWLANAAAENARGERHCFVVRRADNGAVAGSSSYIDISQKNARVEIGSTWYGAAAQASAVNPEAKLLLLGNAFAAGYNCVVFRTDSRNARSRAAILKLGARQDGILRGHMWMRQGYFRDSVFFSILAAEWPPIKRGLEQRLAAFS
jgi:RimJ/RimL family protein N-acetyltransferase